LPDLGPTPTDWFDAGSLWWTHERLHRAALANFPAALAMIAPERDALEAGFRARMAEAWTEGDAAVDAAIQACWLQAAAAEDGWRAEIVANARRGRSSIGKPAALAWARLNAVAGFPRG
jgi:hypothetical protein